MKINASISPNSLVTQMTAFAYERNFAFSAGQIDAVEFSTTEQINVGLSVKDIQPLYDDRGVTLRPERTVSRDPRRLILPPNLFTMKYYEKTHLHKLPEALGPYLRPETKASYQNSFYGELYEVHGVKYTVRKDDEEVGIDRNISYTLHGSEGPLYEIDEGKDTAQWIPLAHEQRSLRVEERIQEEQVDDQIDQLAFNAHFEDFRDGIGHDEFIDSRTKEAAVCIAALLNCLRRGSRIPAYNELVDTA